MGIKDYLTQLYRRFEGSFPKSRPLITQYASALHRSGPYGEHVRRVRSLVDKLPEEERAVALRRFGVLDKVFLLKEQVTSG